MLFSDSVTQRIEAWKGYARDFDEFAFQEVNQINNDHLVFVALHVPLRNGDTIMKVCGSISQIWDNGGSARVGS